MKVNDLKKFLGGLIDKRVYVPALMVGGMGLGKTQLVAQLSVEKNARLVDLRLSQMESVDLTGIPYRDEHNRTQYAPPSWWPIKGEKVIIMLDEVNRAPTDARQAVFQLIKERKIHTHILPDDCYVFAAINPDNGTYQVEELDRAMIRRFCVLRVEPDTDVWLSWAKGQGGIQDSLTEFINANRGLLFQQEEFKLDVKYNPDAYAMLNTMLKAGAIPPEYQSEVFSGLIGPEASVSLVKWLNKNYNKPVSGTEVLTDLAKVKAKILKQNNAETYNTITDLIACLAEKKMIEPKGMENLTEFTLILPKESQTALISKLPRHVRDPLLKNPKIAKIMIDIVSQ